MELLLPGFCAALILVGIHAYLGIHVIERGVIFVDLAMAQSAALGTMVGYIFFLQGPDHPITYIFSLGFTLVHAAMFAAGRSKKSKLPEEAVIGLTYAILSAITVLLIDRAPHGAERIRDMLAGHVLWVSWDNVIKTGLLYASVGLVHFIWHKRFIQISRDPEGAKEQGISVAFWDFVFYATFGIIITSSVAIGGVLLVFTLLVAPAIMGFLYAGSFRKRLLVGYAFGFLITLSGFLVSYYSDTPTGATVVALFGVVLFPIGIFRYVMKQQNGRKLRLLITGIGVVGFLGSLLFAWQIRPHYHAHHADHAHGHTKHGKDFHPSHLQTPSTPAHKRTNAHPRPRVTKPTLSRTPVSPVRPRPTPRITKQSKQAQIAALLKQMEGQNDESLLDRQAAFHKLCKLTNGRLPSCPFSGNLFQLGGWLNKRAKSIKQALQPSSPQTPHTHGKRPPTSQPTTLPMPKAGSRGQ
jgi:zinc/manganese transport system permease protein